MKKNIAYISIVVVAVAVVFFIYNNKNDIVIKPSDVDNLIVLVVPIKNAEISSPLVVAGRARGSWFMDSKFPIILLDSYDNVVSESHATAQSKWKNDEFVKFTGNIQFSNFIKGSKGKLVLKKDNSTGLPEYDDSLEIPIIFK